MRVRNQMALLANLRNIEEAGVSAAHRSKLLRAFADEEAWRNTKLLPFRFVAASKAAPSYAQALSDVMLKAISTEEKLRGSTALLIDVSGSMDVMLSAKGTLSRWEAAAALAVLVREMCDEVRVFTFSERLKEVSNYRGLPLIDHVGRSQPHSGTALSVSLAAMFKGYTPDRVIVVTDEQSHDGILPLPKGTKGYLVNVAPYHPGLDVSGGWTRINGFSERILDWVRFEEKPAE